MGGSHVASCHSRGSFQVRAGLTFDFSQSANAQTAYCWMNAKTGVPVPANDLYPGGSVHDPSDPNHATIGSHLTNAVPTQTFFRGSDNTWTNSATGVPGLANDLYPGGSVHDPSDPNHATIGSHLTNAVPRKLSFASHVRQPTPQPHRQFKAACYRVA